MWRPSSFIAICALFLSISLETTFALETEVWEEVSHNVRVMRHRDGTNTEYRRSNDEKTLIKRRLSDVKGGRNAILTTTVYRMDKRGNPLSCKIFDGKENLMFKVSYGYHRETGRLVAENMFDARAPKKDPKTGEELPVRRMYWFYDGSGNISKAFSFVFREGDYADEKYGKNSIPSTFPKDNPFRNGGQPGAAPVDDNEFDAPPPLPPLPFQQ